MLHGLLIVVASLLAEHRLSGASIIAACGLSSCSAQAQSLWLSCSADCGVVLDQGWNPCLLLLQAHSLPPSHQGSPNEDFIGDKSITVFSFIVASASIASSTFHSSNSLICYLTYALNFLTWVTVFFVFWFPVGSFSNFPVLSSCFLVLSLKFLYLHFLLSFR